MNFLDFYGIYFDFLGIFPDLILFKKGQKGLYLLRRTRGAHGDAGMAPTWPVQ